MNAINNYAAFYKLSNTSNLIGSMMGNNAISSISSLGQIGNFAQMNDAKLAMIMNSANSNIAGNTQLSQNYQSYQKEASAFSRDLSSVTDNLKASSQKLIQYNQNSVMNPTGYGSKNGSVASVTSDKTGVSATNTPIELKVSQLATSQKDQSASLSSAGKNLGGSSSITLTGANGESKRLSFNFSYSTTNKDALSQMAQKINESKMGVTAKIVEKDGKSSLSIVSDKTGTDAGFTATVSGSAASKLQLSTKTEAQNAIYTENGFTKNSQTNDITLADGKISATIKGLGTTSLEKNVRDNSAVVDAAKKFASDYNDALDLFSKYSNRSPAMASMASAFSSTRYSSSALNEIGINVSSSGRLSIDSTRLTAALEKTPQKVTDILSGKDGLAQSAQQKITAAKINERNLFPPASQAQNAFSPSSYNKNLNFITTYLSGTFLNSMI